MNTLLMYGKTGSTKTTQIARIAKELRSLYMALGMENPMFRLITADSGWGPMDDIIRSPDNPDGFVEALNLELFSDPFGALNALADGRWLKTVETPTGVQLVFTKETRYPDNVIGTFVEGLNSIADVLLQDHVNQGRKIGQDLSAKIPVSAAVEGQPGAKLVYNIGAAGQSHYGQVQRFLMMDMFPKFKSLKNESGGSVPWLVFTAHEAEGSDDFDKKVLGPATIGRAIVGATPQKFQDCLHLQKLVDPKTGARSVRAYFWDHPEPSMPVAGGFMLWPAKVSFPPEIAQGLDKKWPGGFIPLEWNSGVEELVRIRFTGKV